MNCPAIACLLSLIGVVACPCELTADDWSTFGRDNRRSRVSEEDIETESLGLRWQWSSSMPPIAAWSQPAKGDAYSNIRDFQSMRNYDSAFHPVIANGDVYVSSNIDDCVRCVDEESGKVRWMFTTGGPVRIAPTYANGKVYFGSDDGYAYCIDAETGQLLWRYSPSRNYADSTVSSTRLVVNDGRLISFWPCRSGVLVDGGKAYFACSLLPWKPSFLCAVDASTGKAEERGTFIKKLDSVTLEGPLVASADLLFSPQGRESPLQFQRTDGKFLGALGDGFGVFCVLTPDNRLLHGPRPRDGGIVDSHAKTRAPIATHKSAKAMIVAGDISYMLTGTSLLASDMKARKVKWSVPQKDALTLVVAGDRLLLGKKDCVVALDVATGKEVWQSVVDGYAYELAVANGAIFVSTDMGNLYCFHPQGNQVDSEYSWNHADHNIDTDTPSAQKSLPLVATDVSPLNDESVSGHWVFSPRVAQNLTNQTQFKNLARNRDIASAPATLVGSRLLTHDGSLTAVKFDGESTSANISQGKLRKETLPRQALTSEAWVRIDRPMKWGGIIGAIQDNGNYEKGWLLGYRDAKFTFALATTDGPGKLTYMSSRNEFRVGQWHHVVGTYDGKRMALYVDGELSAASTAQQGDVDYPDEAFYEIGAYRDANEFYRTTGLFHEIRVYHRALSADEIKQHFEDKPLPDSKSNWQPDAGPWVKFDSANSATVNWRTNTAQLGAVVVTDEQGRERRFQNDGATSRHNISVTGLRRDRRYSYQIIGGDNIDKHVSRPYEIDTYFNFNLASPTLSNVQTSDSAANAAKNILSGVKFQQGLCIVLGSETGELALQLATRSQLRVIGIEADASKIQQARQLALSSGMAGPRLSFVQVSTFEDLPLPPHIARLVVSQSAMTEGAWPTSADEIVRLLQPNGIVVAPQTPTRETAKFPRSEELQIEQSDAFTIGRRRSLDQAGVWTHMYGDAANAAYTGEALAGVKTVDELEISWFGRPGPRYQTDRQNRKSAPLFAGGRLYMQGQERLICLDAYNGQVLWSLEVPNLLRFNIPRDTSNWCCDLQHLFVAVRDRLWQIDGETGEVLRITQTVASSRSNADFDWGYVGRSGEMVIGTSVVAGSAYVDFWGGEYWFDQEEGKFTHQVCSDNIFAYKKGQTQIAWKYEHGMIWNATITAGGDRLYFVESRNPKLRTQPSGRLGSPEMWESQFLVALDLTTGKKLWEQAIQTKPNLLLANMAFSGGQLILATSVDKHFPVRCFDATNGKLQWNARIAWPRSDHGGHLSRPAIVGDKLFLRPAVLSMKTGEILSNNLPGGGCGTYVCSRDALFFRAGSGKSLSAWNPETGSYTHWSRLRPDCWLSTIPAGGMLLSPEGGGGCSCGKWMQMSIGFAPRDDKQ